MKFEAVVDILPQHRQLRNTYDVKSPRDWSYSTFHRWVKRGVYNPDWVIH